MPELPEVEIVCQALKPVLEGQRITYVQLNRKDLRYPFPSDLSTEVMRTPIIHVTRRAKYILINLSHGKTLIWHLGMSGCFKIEHSSNPLSEAGPHDHVILTTSNNDIITYRDPRRFGFLLLRPTEQMGTLSPFNTIGPEPLDMTSLNAAAFHTALNNRESPIKNVLLDQKVIAGLGNIYVSEALWRSKLSPLRGANTLTLDHANTLLNEIRNVLREAIAAGGSTLRDHKQPDGNIGYFQHSFRVYNKASEICQHCKVSMIVKIVQSGRSTYYCPTCQT